MTGPRRPQLGALLLAAGALTEAQLERALTEQSSWGGRLGQNLVALGFLDEETLLAALGHQLQLPTVDLDRFEIPTEAVRLLPVGVAERYGLVPLWADLRARRMRLACFDPTHAEALGVAARAAGLVCEPVLATPSSIHRAIRRAYYGEARPPETAAGPRFNVTSNTIDPEAARKAEHAIDTRLAALEARIDALIGAVAALTERLARRGDLPPGPGPMP